MAHASPSSTSRKRAALGCGFLVLLAGCGGDARATRRARELQDRGRTLISTLRPSLSPPQEHDVAEDVKWEPATTSVAVLSPLAVTIRGETILVQSSGGPEMPALAFRLQLTNPTQFEIGLRVSFLAMEYDGYAQFLLLPESAEDESRDTEATEDDWRKTRQSGILVLTCSRRDSATYPLNDVSITFQGRTAAVKPDEVQPEFLLGEQYDVLLTGDGTSLRCSFEARSGMPAVYQPTINLSTASLEDEKRLRKGTYRLLLLGKRKAFARIELTGIRGRGVTILPPDRHSPLAMARLHFARGEAALAAEQYAEAGSLKRWDRAARACARAKADPAFSDLSEVYRAAEQWRSCLALIRFKLERYVAAEDWDEIHALRDTFPEGSFLNTHLTGLARTYPSPTK